MFILGIETSCDESSCAVLKKEGDSFEILSELVSSQTEIHEKYGGVVPELASREHLRNLPVVLDTVLGRAGISIDDVGLIGVTTGPGLKGCLLVGLSFAQGLSLPKSIPLIGINHIEGHILVPLLDDVSHAFPYLALVVSGGHTEIVLVKGIGSYEILDRTLDDAAGEAFDKSANLLGLNYPGGAKLANLADSKEESRFRLPKVMREANGFSFSGLKTSVSLLIKKNQNELIDPDLRAEMAFAIQESIVDALVYKVREAVKRTGVKNITVTGGVSANRKLRESVSNLSGCRVSYPKLEHCTDNATMIAYVAGLRYPKYLVGDLSVRSRWPVEEI